VYDPERNDNELRSANIARRHLLELGWSEDSLKSIYVSILATDHKGGMLVEEATKWVVDIDLSSLADQPVVFDQNTKDIRFEYEHAANFTPEKWREGRLAFAKGMLSRGYIFYTEHFRQTLEGKAIANLKRTIEELEDAA
jgi:predicted metal-dependent HD superfamily phosphohydrolase